MQPITYTGDKEIDRRLKALSEADQKKGIRKGLRVGAKIVAAEARARAPRGATGDLVAAIKVRSMKRSRKAVGVNAIIGKGWFRGPTFYAAFLEFGAPGHKYFGKGVAPLAPRKFLSGAWESKKGEARSKTLRAILGAIESTARSGR